ncbi:Lpp/OprI family alanine-zipper lipoprotein [Halorhodospira neutriphila]|nr:Lpp/OprI family alanine-zipper lipoprotein [Halorhodospira neutriphila]
MPKRTAPVLKVTAVGAAVGLMSACATVDEARLNSMIDERLDERMQEQVSQEEVDQTRNIAQDALETARMADGSAQEAQLAADKAMRKANENEEKIDRMFERSMQK